MTSLMKAFVFCYKIQFQEMACGPKCMAFMIFMSIWGIIFLNGKRVDSRKRPQKRRRYDCAWSDSIHDSIPGSCAQYPVPLDILRSRDIFGQGATLKDPKASIAAAYRTNLSLTTYKPDEPRSAHVFPEQRSVKPADCKTLNFDPLCRK
ncbi:hypothetical protein TELCIR_15528 [Teladorsagia circumcincta]|uniref:Uncharacterized protein n=1 Tax=Teladorsagia circumcincta TaxID=45464 RepID=A0A2G9TY03_TELCI|nr:hypothetical protein TELCIR_15528 [Teladorsagia circumcincta]